MHPSALSLAAKFFRDYVKDPRVIVEVGSMDVNGTLRGLQPRNCLWLGFDREWGSGVDLLIDEDGLIPIGDGLADASLASSVFEHDPFFWQTFVEMARVTKVGGFIYINAPSNGPVHRHPVDCWRLYPDAGQALADWAAKNGYSVSLQETKVMDEPSQGWLDFYAVYQRTV